MAGHAIRDLPLGEHASITLVGRANGDSSTGTTAAQPTDRWKDWYAARLGRLLED